MKRTLSLLTCIALAVISCVALAGCSSAPKATEGAKEYVTQMYPGWSIQGVVAKDFDSSGDGYVTTDVSIKNDKTGETKIVSLSCAKAFSLNSGCKLRAGVMQNTGN
jgi:starvation-inducible outer membrane lipoprotein